MTAAGEAAAPIEARFAAAVAAQTSGDAARAAELYEGVLRDRPDHPGALANLGRLARVRGDLPAAIALYARAAAAPGAPGEVFFNLGNARAAAGDLPAALEAYSAACARAPALAPAHAKRRELALKIGTPADALAAARDAARARPRDPEAARDWASLADAHGTTEEAIKAARAAASLDGPGSDSATRLAQLLLASGDGEGAVAVLQRATAARPEAAAVWHNLGFAYRSTGHYAKALAAYRTCLDREPVQPMVEVEIANCLVNLGRPGEARTLFAGLVATDAGRAAAASGYLMSLLYDPDTAPETITAEHRRLTADWPVAAARPAPARPTRALRVGYVTADFYGDHPVAQFIAPLLAHHARLDVDQRVYLARVGRDATSAWLPPGVRAQSIEALDDDAAAALIARDDLDLLVDLSGHTSRHRLRLLGRRPAPVQACFVGYPGTTGFRAVDVLFADAALAPPGSEGLYAERLERLSSWLAFTPPPSFPVLPERRADERRVVFGSLNHLPKFNPAVADLWAEVLRAAPGADLLLKCAAFAEADTAKAVAALFTERGIAPERLRLEGPEVFPAAMGAYGRIDIALDPFPYNGGTTTAHALFAGCPTVSLAGRYFCGRMGASLLAAVGRPDWVAESPADYVRIAAGLAADRAELNRLQRELRAEFAETRLGDVAAWAEDVRTAYAGLAGR